jgi:hypothetical protein
MRNAAKRLRAYSSTMWPIDGPQQQGDHDAGPVLAERALHDGGIGRGIGEDGERLGDRRTARLAELEVAVGDVHGIAPALPVVAAPEQITERKVMPRRAGCDRVVRPRDLVIAAQIDHGGDTELLEAPPVARGRADERVRPEESARAHGRAVGDGKPADVAEVDATLELDRKFGVLRDHRHDGTVRCAPLATVSTG